MQKQLIFDGMVIKTNQQMYELTVRLAKQEDKKDFYRFVEIYERFNTVGRANLLFQVGYIGSNEEAKLVQLLLKNT